MNNKLEIDVYKFSGENADESEPQICSHFGYGRELSHREKLFGDKCVAHSGQDYFKKFTIDIVIQIARIKCS